MEKDITYNYDNMNKDNIWRRSCETNFTDEAGDDDYDYINSYGYHSSYDDEYYD